MLDKRFDQERKTFRYLKKKTTVKKLEIKVKDDQFQQFMKDSII